ncbi:ATP-binding cassette domain-containing protein [Pseudobutyrivibrio xylanivorans]|uniref:ATP-binding cassette domain-containing protein n=1 Tax=Pseudobutyrivibrio xylanivorans TaxID=185007 RepID=A0A5P6VVX9_PSEXY|nr:ATP-binding cassette domain-containing protein [Pseudobutyrivibrio xylanivorans]
MYEIEIKHLTKTFEDKVSKVDAITDINLNIEKGDIFGIIGMSGAGKSTLIRCLNYLERPTSGQVIIEGKELGSLSEKELRKERQEISMIFQHFNLLQQKCVLDNVMFPITLQGVKKAETKKKAIALLEEVGLADKAKAYPSQLSGGQQQRVAIARALASNPKILLCDEATSALDPATTASILSLLKQINKEHGITIVLITHQMSVVKAICNKVAVLEEGHLIDTGKIGEVSLPEDKFFWIDGDSRLNDRRTCADKITDAEVDGYVG